MIRKEMALLSKKVREVEFVVEVKNYEEKRFGNNKNVSRPSSGEKSSVFQLRD